MLAQEERKACGEFGGAEIKDCETENMATQCHSQSKQFIRKLYSKNHMSKMVKEVCMERKKMCKLTKTR